MKKFLKSSALALLFFIAHWVVQLFFSILIANIVVFIDTLKIHCRLRTAELLFTKALKLH